MCQTVVGAPLPPPTQNLCLHRCIDVSGQAIPVLDTAKKIADIRLSKNAPKKFPDYLRYTTAGVSENEDYQITIGTDHCGRAK